MTVNEGVRRFFEMNEAEKLYSRGIALKYPSITNDAVLKCLVNGPTQAYLEVMF